MPPLQFYRGELEPTSILGGSSIDPHSEYCEQLSAQLSAHEEQQRLASSAQVVLHESDKALSSLRRIHAHNCSPVSTLSPETHGTLAFDPRGPLLQFMLKATPKSSVVQHIESQYDSLVDSLESTFEHSFIQGRQTMIQHISNVPDTVSPVKARFAYTQVPVGDRVELHPIWKVCTSYT
jgi:extracellular elastinolytic metalloproteinase